MDQKTENALGDIFAARQKMELAVTALRSAALELAEVHVEIESQAEGIPLVPAVNAYLKFSEEVESQWRTLITS